MGYILGLDISTSVVGAAIVDSETDELKGLFYISLKKQKGLINKAKALQMELQKYVDIVDEVAIEEPLVAFKEGYSSAQVLSLLSRFNGMGQLISFLLYNTEPVMYNVASARSQALPSLKWPKGVKRKIIVQECVAKLYPDVDWPKKPKAKKPDGSPQLKDECFDMADAVVIARAHSKAIRDGSVL
jgi:hypothetical protein